MKNRNSFLKGALCGALAMLLVAGLVSCGLKVNNGNSDITSKTEKTRLRKEWDKVDRIVTEEGQFTAYCNFEKPSMDLPLKIKGA